MRSCSAREDVCPRFERVVFGGHFDFDRVEGALDGFLEGQAEVVADFFRGIDGEGSWIRGGVRDVGGGGHFFAGLEVDGGGNAEVGFEVEADGLFSLVEDIG